MDRNYFTARVNDFLRLSEKQYFSSEWYQKYFSEICRMAAEVLLFSEEEDIEFVRKTMEPLKEHWPLS